VIFLSQTAQFEMEPVSLQVNVPVKEELLVETALPGEFELQ